MPGMQTKTRRRWTEFHRLGDLPMDIISTSGLINWLLSLRSISPTLPLQTDQVSLSYEDKCRCWKRLNFFGCLAAVSMEPYEHVRMLIHISGYNQGPDGHALDRRKRRKGWGSGRGSLLSASPNIIPQSSPPPLVSLFQYWVKELMTILD